MEQQDQGHQAAPSGSVPSAASKETPRSVATLVIAAAIAAIFGNQTGRLTRKARRPVPRMVCSPAAEIAAWNDQVRPRNKRKGLGEKIRRQPRDSGQHPKFAKERVHKQHKHELRDEHGAYTLVGRDPIYADIDQQPMRRKWLAGISAQRGY